MFVTHHPDGHSTNRTKVIGRTFSSAVQGSEIVLKVLKLNTLKARWFAVDEIKPDLASSFSSLHR